jgi:RNA polymerase sigma-70 factor, ECF subfamily
VTAIAVPAMDDRAEDDHLRELVRRTLDGDRAAAASFYARFHPTVLAVHLAATGGDRHLAADLTQDTFTKVLYRLDQYEWRGPASLRGWIITIARNTFRDHVRSAAERHHGGHTLPEVVDPTDEHRPEAAIERDLDGARELTGRVLEQLKPEHQHVLRRLVGDGWSVAEVAREIGRTEAAVHQLRRRALTAARCSAERLLAASSSPDGAGLAPGSSRTAGPQQTPDLPACSEGGGR